MTSPDTFVFISHASKDSEFVRKLVTDIEKRNIPCWLSSRDIEPGADYQHAIVTAMSACAAMLVVFSSNANVSKEIAKELAVASARSKPIFPVRIEDIMPTGTLEYQMSNAQFIDLFHNYADSLDRLCLALGRQLSGSSVLPTAMVRGRGRRLPLFAGVAAGALVVIGGFGFVLHEATRPSLSVSQPPRQPVQVAAAPTSVSGSPPRPATAPDASVAPAPTVRAPAPAAPPPPVPASSPPQPVVAVPTTAPALPDARSSPPASPVAPETVARIAAMQPNYREAAIQSAVVGSDSQFTYDQANQLLSDTSQYTRQSILLAILPHLPTPLTAPVAAQFLRDTENYRIDTLQRMSGRLADTLSGDDIALLLGDTGQNARSEGVRLLVEHAPGPITVPQALKLLDETGNYWTSTLSYIVPRLVRPLGGADLSRLLGSTAQNSRLDAIHALLPVMAETLSPAEVNALLDGLDNYRVSGIQTIVRHLPSDMSIAETSTILSETTQNLRLSAIDLLVPHMKKGLAGKDLRPVLDETDNYWTSAVHDLVSVLDRPQSAADVEALLGDTSQNSRLQALSSLRGVLPLNVTATDAGRMLAGMDNYYADGLRLLIPHLGTLSAADINTLLAPVSNAGDQGTLSSLLYKKQ